MNSSHIRSSSQVRKDFLDFFKSKQHTIVPSSSLMPDSPNLLFTNAGMNQFVPIFLGQTRCPFTPGRAADTQKCIRAGGKHNDLDDVGLDTYHHTFFEMLGNWSFGDYFKQEAIAWAWELVVNVWKFPPQRLYATVYNPDKSKNDPSEFDQDAWNCWAEKFRSVGLDPAVHIVNGNKKDNFWMMGETGPCGPCSELHVDLTPGPRETDPEAQQAAAGLVNKGSPQCIEIWNLVFIQFNAQPRGGDALVADVAPTATGASQPLVEFVPLAQKHVDTGMGFERVTSIMQGTKGLTDFANAKISNYETDIFRPIFDALEKLSGKKYGSTLPGEHTRPRVLPSAPPPMAAGAPGSSEAKYSRRNLPHFERPWAKYMVTFSTHQRRQLAAVERDLALKSVLYAHEHHQYQLYAACVMPDHVHLLFEPQIKEQDKDGNPVFWSLSHILQGIKSASAHNITKASGRSEHIWEKESLDRMIRGQSDMEEKFHYICRNPWDAGIVPMTESYPWLWTPDANAGEHTRQRLSQSAPSPIASGCAEDVVGGAPTTAREGACAPPEAAAPLSMSEQEKSDVAFRVIADHIRTLSSAIADGIQPGNTDRNYVLRRILRRAVRYGRSLGFHEPFFYKLVDVLADTMGDIFPEIRAKKKHVQEVIRVEEEAFNKTLDKGIEVFETMVIPHNLSNSLEVVSLEERSATQEALTENTTQWVYRPTADIPGEVLANTERFRVQRRDTKQVIHEGSRADLYRRGWRELVSPAPTIAGEDAFKLYDTYGFPLDLTELMARERGLTVDKEGFEKLMEEQRARARAAQKKEVISLSQIETTTPTKFVGFESLEAQAKVLEVVALKDKTAVILDASPCYAEMGGQVGDTGELEHGSQLWRVTNTQKSGNTWLHFLGESDAPTVGSEVTLTVDADRRGAIQRHHTVTHLLHWAIHEVVSKEASQKGSFVGPDKLTFDFNSAPLTPQQVADIEKLVNERILENAGVTWTEVKYNHIKDRKEIMQFFGDKYGEWVRVVQIGGKPTALDGYSMELCGGTHTRATGEIGLFRIVGENAIAAGVRRIEAIAGLEAYRKATDELALIKSLASRVNSPIHELEKKIENLLEQQRALEKQLKAMQQKEAASAAKALLAKATTLNGIPAIIERFDADGETLQNMVNELRGQFEGVILLAGAANNAVALVAAVSPQFTGKVQAGKLIQQIAPIVGGKGGGKPDSARGGGKDASKLDEALAKARTISVETSGSGLKSV